MNNELESSLPPEARDFVVPPETGQDFATLPTAEAARQAGYRVNGEIMSRIQDSVGNWHELPEPGFVASQFWVNEDESAPVKGKGYGQALLLATAKEYGTYYSLNEKRLDPTKHVLDALERKGLVTLTPVSIGEYEFIMVKPT